MNCMRPNDKIQLRQSFEKLNTHPSFFIISLPYRNFEPLLAFVATKENALIFSNSKGLPQSSKVPLRFAKGIK